MILGFEQLPELVQNAFQSSEYSSIAWRIYDVDNIEHWQEGTCCITEVESRYEIKLYYLEDGTLTKKV